MRYCNNMFYIYIIVETSPPQTGQLSNFVPSRLSALCAALPVGVTGIEADEAASLVGRPAGGRCGSDSANIACRLKASSTIESNAQSIPTGARFRRDNARLTRIHCRARCYR